MMSMNDCLCGGKTVKVKDGPNGKYFCQCHHCKKSTGESAAVDGAISIWNEKNPQVPKELEITNEQRIIEQAMGERNTPSSKARVAHVRNDGTVIVEEIQPSSQPDLIFNKDTKQVEEVGGNSSEKAPLQANLTPSGEGSVAKKGRGRPKGSPNKPKKDPIGPPPSAPTVPHPSEVVGKKRGRPTGSKNAPKVEA